MDAFLVIETVSRGLWRNTSTFLELQGDRLSCTGADCAMAGPMLFGAEIGFPCTALNVRKTDRVEE